MRILGIILLAVAALLVAVTGLSRIRFDTDPLGMLPADLNGVRGFRLFLEHFAQRDELIVAISGPDAARTLAAAENLANHLKAEPSLVTLVADRPILEEDPAQVAEMAAYLLANAEPSIVEGRLAAMAPGHVEATLEATLEDLATDLDLQDVLLAGYDPFGLARAAMDGAVPGAGFGAEFASEDGRFRVLFVRGSGLDLDYRRTTRWIGEIRASLADWRAANPDLAASIDLALTGEPAFVAEISSSMQRDMRVSGIATLSIIGALFFMVYRRFRPLLALVGVLVLTFLSTLTLAGFFLGGLTAIGVGFASILVGLCVDYGVILYQRALGGEDRPSVLRRRAAPGIFWAALTTAAAFAGLAAGHLPGLTELGVLVAIGIGMGALLMLTVFASIAGRLATRAGRSGRPRVPPTLAAWESPRVSRRLAAAALVVVLALAGGLVARGLPPFEQGSGVLRPRHSEAYDTLDQVYEALSQSERTINLVVRDESAMALQARLAMLADRLSHEGGDDTPLFDEVFVPTRLVPRADHQRVNVPRLAELEDHLDRLSRALDTAGFTPEAFELTRRMIAAWTAWRDQTPPVLPSEGRSRDLLRRLVTFDDQQPGNVDARAPAMALAVIEPAPGASDDALVEAVEAIEDNDHVFTVSWDLLNRRLAAIVGDDLLRMFAILAVSILVVLAVAFRSVVETVLAAAVVVADLAALLGAMSWTGLSWNFVNLGALLLALGAGLDYSIHMLFALREEGGDVRAAQQRTGFALLVCAISTVAGFASLGLASNVGLASLGIISALALSLNALIALFILPWAWHRLRRPPIETRAPA